MTTAEFKPDELTAALDEIRDRWKAASGAQLLAAEVAARKAGARKGGQEVREIASAMDVPRLLAVLDEVLEVHTPIPGDQGWCSECGHSFPCLTQRGISRALLGEESSDG